MCAGGSCASRAANMCQQITARVWVEDSEIGARLVLSPNNGACAGGSGEMARGIYSVYSPHTT